MHGKTAALVPEFAVEDLPSAELLPWFLRVFLGTTHTDDDDIQNLEYSILI